MKTLFKFWIYVFLPLLAITDGCTNFTDPEDFGTGTAGKIEIHYPATNSAISQGYTKIDYTVSSPGSMKFIELYVNSQFIQNFPPKPNGSKPDIILDLDTTIIGQTISIYLIYYDNNGGSSKSNVASNITVTENKNPPYAPYNIRVIRLSLTSLNITWSDSSTNVEGYEIWRKAGIDGTYEKIIEASATAFNKNDENLDPNINYFYKVRGFNSFGTSGFSSEVNSNGTSGSGSLAPPSNLTVTAAGSRKIRLSWKDNSNNENFFKIMRKMTWQEYEPIGFVPANVTEYTDSLNGLNPGQVYYYRIIAYSESDSAMSNEAFAQTYPYDMKRPTDLTAVFNVVQRKVELIWNDPDLYNTFFEIERKEAGGTFAVIAVIVGTLNSYKDSVLSIDKYYTYRVRSSDGLYYSDYSNEATVFTGIPPVLPPQNFKGEYIPDGKKVRLTWEYNSPAYPLTHFQIERRSVSGGGTFFKIAEVSGSTFQYDDLNTVGPVEYAYRIRGRKDNSFFTPYSDTVNVTNPGL